MRPTIPFLLFSLAMSGCGASPADTVRKHNESVQPPPEELPASIDLPTELNRVIGISMNWKAAYFTRIQAGQSCDDVRAAFPSLGMCNSKQDFDFVDAAIKDDAIVAGLTFSFYLGKVDEARIRFKRGLDRQAFKTASFTAFVNKWDGAVASEKDDDILTAVSSNFQLAQRSYMVDHWEINCSLED